MEERLKDITIIFFVAVVMFGTVAFAKSSSTLLQEGLYAEQVDGDFDAAIKIYEKIIEDGSYQRSHIAQAMYRQGMCYLKKQNESKAEEVFGRLVANYSDQTKVIDKVKPLLEELGHADPAALMPPGTLIYIETGSPGKQIATILNMLKGTPYENPFALLGGGKSQKSPGDMTAALFNPSMMAEFKKIRGMGIGVTGVSQNNPPSIAVLYPGKSDALRGLILAGLGMVAKPGEPIEGMDTLRIHNAAGIAYDDKVIIIAQPIEQLTWAVKQYKDVTSEPTLASSNKSFTKISKKGRQENALTIWANVNDVYTGVSKVIPKEDIPPQVRIADGIADFKNIDDMLVSINIQEDGIAIEKSLAFKDGHQCIAYNMIRTPNLSKAGLEAVPSDAVGLVSIAFGDAESAQVAAASKSIKNLTGLDIGREVFANIEQINIFALPPSASKSNVTRPPIAGNLGLAITSHNPQQTRQLLTQLLTVANLVTGQTDVGQTAQGAGKYQVALVNNQPICCYMNHMNKTTVLSLDPDIVEASISAMKRRRSVYSAGPLKEAVSKLSPSTSKLVLVNVGGAIEVADSSLTAIYKNPQNPSHKTLAQLAKACSKTSVQIGTDEQINNFSVRLNINKLPPLGNLFPLLMQLSQVDPTQKAVASKPEPRDGAIVGLPSVKKWKWKKGVKAKSNKVYFGTQADQLGLLAEVKGSSYDKLPHLEEGTRYYWRVDEIWDDGTVIKGNVWSFTTGKLVGWWKLDSDVKDSSDSGNDGTEIGDPKYVAGKIGQAISFDGIDDHIIVGTNERPTDTFSFGGWLKTSATHEIDSESISDWNGVNNQRYAFDPQNGGESNSGAGLSVGTNGISVYEHGSFYMPATAVYEADIGNDWNHIMVVYNNKQPTIFLNGSAVRTGFSSPRAIISAPIRFGGMEYGYFEGLMDEVRIYNYALSEGEITALYNEGK